MTTLTQTCTALPRAANRGFWTRLTSAGSLWRQRQALAAMPDHMLDDLGISRADAMAEAAKPMWDVPQHWLK